MFSSLLSQVVGVNHASLMSLGCPKAQQVYTRVTKHTIREFALWMVYDRLGCIMNGGVYVVIRWSLLGTYICFITTSLDAVDEIEK